MDYSVSVSSLACIYVPILRFLPPLPSFACLIPLAAEGKLYIADPYNGIIPSVLDLMPYESFYSNSSLFRVGLLDLVFD
jgi:hypothetical protein